MNRRDFSKLVLTLPALTGCTSNSDESFIDTHCHLWESDDSLNCYAKYELAEIQEIAEPAGVRRFVVVVLHSDINEKYVMKVRQQHPDKVRVIANINPAQKNLAEEMKLNREKGVLGYRINSKFDGESWLKRPGVDKMWEIAADLDISICLLRKENVSVKSVLDMMKRHPGTKVVIDHLGLVNPQSIKEVSEFLELAQFEKCYVKFSRFFTDRVKQTGTEVIVPFFKKLNTAFGSERLMWGSNAPVEVGQKSDYSRAVNLIKEATFLSEKDKQNIMEKTAEKLFF